ncbi:hypothetical protein M5K25_022742 [Dendrobium thyrsiflorum]|uniref:DUF4283 domain-containing protein n=1 Tax=Dendrobium thyrsiflorum TaxID=117978 RepID=A0ABD0UD13_DENTH
MALNDFPPLHQDSLLGPPPTAPVTSWTNHFSPSAPVSDDFSMCFVPPSQQLYFTVDDLLEGTSLWNLSLVGYSIGQRPYYERLLASMNKLWSLKDSLSLLSLAEGFFLLKFTNLDDYNMVFSGGPWFLLGKPFIIQKWYSKFKPKRDEFASIPLWVKILDVPLALWTPSEISKITSYIGIPLSMYSLTAKRTRLTFAKVCIHISRTSTLPEEIPLLIDAEEFILNVVYDWKPSHYESYESVVHLSNLCPSNPNNIPIVQDRNKPRGRNDVLIFRVASTQNSLNLRHILNEFVDATALKRERNTRRFNGNWTSPRAVINSVKNAARLKAFKWKAFDLIKETFHEFFS